eukprot:gene56631-biopygen56648
METDAVLKNCYEVSIPFFGNNFGLRSSEPSFRLRLLSILQYSYCTACTVGALVTVITGFMPDGDDEVLLSVGQQGVVREIDDDGGASIEFPEHPDGVWVFQSNFRHLRFHAAATCREVAGFDDSQLQLPAPGPGMGH